MEQLTETEIKAVNQIKVFLHAQADYATFMEEAAGAQMEILTLINEASKHSDDICVTNLSAFIFHALEAMKIIKQFQK